MLNVSRISDVSRIASTAFFLFAGAFIVCCGARQVKKVARQFRGGAWVPPTYCPADDLFCGKAAQRLSQFQGLVGVRILMDWVGVCGSGFWTLMVREVLSGCVGNFPDRENDREFCEREG